MNHLAVWGCLLGSLLAMPALHAQQPIKAVPQTERKTKPARVEEPASELPPPASELPTELPRPERSARGPRSARSPRGPRGAPPIVPRLHVPGS
jgi:hypothetical protein